MYVFFYLLMRPRSRQTITQKAEHENAIIINNADIISTGMPIIIVVNIV